MLESEVEDHGSLQKPHQTRMCANRNTDHIVHTANLMRNWNKIQQVWGGLYDI
jgi:hypothetical protein